MGGNTIKNLAFCLQFITGLATSGMYFRLISDLKLPQIFLVLPACLVSFPVLTRFTNIFTDLSSRETVTGVLTGVTCSFLSAVGNDNKVQLIVISPFTEHYIPPWMAFIRGLELLFMPLLLSVILLTFLTTVQRIPTTSGIATAAATAFSADLTIVTCFVMLRSDDIRGSDVIANILLLLVPFFLLSLMPLFRDKSRAWLFSLVLLFLLIFWEVIFLGTAIWSWKKKTFPIPGALVAVIYVFHSVYLDVDRLLEVQEKSASLLPLASKKGHPQRRPQPNIPLYNNHLSGSLIWHFIAFIVERLALYRIFNHPLVSTDCPIVCITLLFILLIMSVYMDGTKTRRMVMITLILMCFIAVCLHKGVFNNTYVVEMILGMSIVCITDVL